MLMPSLDITINQDHDDIEVKQVLTEANAYRTTLSYPKQSNFRVIAVLVYQDAVDRNVHHLLGANCEPCHIAGAICAERSALIQLRHRPNPVSLLRIYIVSDAVGTPIPPGMLCREYMTSMAGDDLPIILADASTSTIQHFTLGQLYPYPSLYRHLSRADLLQTAESFIASKGFTDPSTLSPQVAQLYQAALKINARDDRDDHHPIRYSSAMLLSNGETVVSWQKKGLEYGTTLDAITQLAHSMESQPASVKVMMLVQVDQYGIAHAPFGGARAFLKEFGHGHVQVIVHNRDGKCVIVTADDLAPSEPAIEFGRTSGDGKEKTQRMNDAYPESKD